MALSVVKFSIQGDSDPRPHAFMLPTGTSGGGAVTLGDLRAAFPLRQGGSPTAGSGGGGPTAWHFRAKRNDPARGARGGWVWQDLCADSDPVPTGPDGDIVLKVLPLGFDDTVEDEPSAAPSTSTTAAAPPPDELSGDEDAGGESWGSFKGQRAGQGTAAPAQAPAAPARSAAPTASARTGAPSSSLSSRPMPQQKKKSGGGWGSKLLRSAAKFVDRAAEAVTELASGGSEVPSPAQCAALSKVVTRRQTPFTRGHPAHGALLEAFWAGAVAALGDGWGGGAKAREFRRVSPRWMGLGFRSADPAKDLERPKKAGAPYAGVLPLECLAHLGSERAPPAARASLARSLRAAHRAVADRKAGKNKGAPPKLPATAAAAVALAAALCDLIGVAAGGQALFAKQKARYWALFEDAGAFDALFCLGFRALERTWLEGAARRAGGGRKGAARKGEDLRTAVAEAVAQVKRVLDEGPKTPAELDGLATMLGVVV